ncbi:MAG: hypothetical protein HDR16_11375 [Lachnospiraceae bacterium]|nr:hypothetical protein [Lachnospiraceae bacterium]
MGLLYDAFLLYDLCGNRLIRKQYNGSSVDVTEGYQYNERNELTERISGGSLIATTRTAVSSRRSRRGGRANTATTC